MSRRKERSAQRLSVQYSTNLGMLLQLLEIMPKDQVVDVLKMGPEDLRPTARVNLMYHTRKEIISYLADDGIVARPITEVPEGIEISRGWKKLGSSLSYLKGLVMPQGLGSMLAVQALDPKPGETILDMAAAPGGKSCFIGERLKGSGKLLANDISTRRIRSLIFNLSRHGIENALVTNQDARKIDGVSPDRILLDAPCTGTGLLVSQPNIRSEKSFSDSIQLQKIQMNLLQNAYNLLEKGGVCVYSTCALGILENEEVVSQFSSRFHVDNIPTAGLDARIGEDILGVRLVPNLHRCDGFFISKLVKI